MGIFKYILLVSFVLFFLIIGKEVTKLIFKVKSKRVVPVFISLLLVYLIIFSWIKINFISNYRLANQITNQESQLFEGNTYLLHNDSNFAIILIINQNSDNENEITLRKNEYIRITSNEEQKVSILCASCNEEIILEIYRYRGGD